MSSSAAAELLEEILQYIHTSRQMSANGELVRLEGLEEKIADLCAVMSSLPKEEAAEYVARLEAVSDLLSDLGGDLRRDRDSVHEQLMSVGLQKKANMAYKTTSVIDKTPKE